MIVISNHGVNFTVREDDMGTKSTKAAIRLRRGVRKILTGAIDDIDGVLKKRGKETSQVFSDTFVEILSEEWDKGKEKLKEKLKEKGETNGETTRNRTGTHEGS